MAPAFHRNIGIEPEPEIDDDFDYTAGFGNKRGGMEVDS